MKRITPIMRCTDCDKEITSYGIPMINALYKRCKECTLDEIQEIANKIDVTVTKLYTKKAMPSVTTMIVAIDTLRRALQDLENALPRTSIEEGSSSSTKPSTSSDPKTT